MKAQWKRSLGLILSLVMLVCTAAPIPSAYAGGTEEDSVAWEPGDDLGAGGLESSGILLETEAEDFLGAEPDDSDPGSPVHDDGGAVYDLGLGEGQPGSDTLPAPEGIEDAPEEDDELAILLGVTLSVSETPVKMKVGTTKTITFICKGVYAGCVISYSNTNPTAYTCSWGSWSGNKVTMRIQSHCQGSGRIYITLKSPSGDELASGWVPVEIIGSAVSISLSSSSVSPRVGNSSKVTITINNYSGSGTACFSIGNRSVCSAQWENWSGWSIPLTITGRAGGSTKITITFKNSDTDVQLASATISVSVPVDASVSASPTSVSLNQGASAKVSILTTGTSYSGDYLQWQNSNTGVCSVSWASSWTSTGSSLLITGRSNGTATVRVYWKTSSGANRAPSPAIISVTVKGGNPSITVSPSSVTVNPGASQTVTCTAKNMSGSYNFSSTNNNPSLFSCAWTGGWSGSSHNLTITGKSPGTGTITVRLMQDNAEKARTTITVTVSGASDSPSYWFENYDDRQITLALAQRMFGDTAKARTMYRDFNVRGGVCFGIATTSGLMTAPYSPYASNFGRSRIYDLQKTDYSNGLNFTVRNFIEAMHMTQAASSMTRYSGISNMVSAVRDGGLTRPVVVCIFGTTSSGASGHALLAYGTTSNGLKIYDPNWPSQERTLYINGNSWSYEMWSGLTWGSGRPNSGISYIPYSVYQSVWNNRGSLTAGEGSAGGGDYPTIEDTGLCLISTDAMDFTLRKFDRGKAGDVVARYEGGRLAESGIDDVADVSLLGTLPDGTSEYSVMLYVPEDYYFVTNDSEDQEAVKMTLAGRELSVTVETKEKEFELAVSDSQNTAHALLTPGEGEDYSITLGSVREGEPDETTIEGRGHGEAICLGATPTGLYVNNVPGAENGISLGALSDAEEDGLRQDFKLNSDIYEEAFPITASVSEGGTITPADTMLVPVGGNLLYQIQAEEGYTLKAVYVNGVKAVPADEEGLTGVPQYTTAHDGVYEYYFQDVRDLQEIHAEFSKNIDRCEIEVSESDGELTVTVYDPDSGYQLQDGYDYAAGLGDENGQPMLYVTALEQGGYSGMCAQLYGTDTEAKIQTAEYDRSGSAVVVTVTHDEALAVAAAAYDVSSGAMLHYFGHQNIAQDSTEAVRFSLEGLPLPEKVSVKVFLLRDATSARLVDWKTVAVDMSP